MLYFCISCFIFIFEASVTLMYIFDHFISFYFFTFNLTFRFFVFVLITFLHFLFSLNCFNLRFSF